MCRDICDLLLHKMSATSTTTRDEPRAAESLDTVEPAAGSNDVEMVCDSTTNTTPDTDDRQGIFRPILLDVQMLQTRNGFCIKELAYKLPPFNVADLTKNYWPLPDRSLHYICFRHDPKNVPKHCAVRVDGILHDRFTGLEIARGDEDYSDERVVYELSNCDVIFIKGHNKKRLLLDVFKRCSHIAPKMPRVVNVDSVTMDEEDMSFCQSHNITGAKFSFKFVYQKFTTYLDLLCGGDQKIPPADWPLYLNNVISNDPRYKTFARGRSVWMCPHDHTCGQRFFTSQRCAALNVGLLETLWYMLRDADFRELLKRNNVRRSALVTRRRFDEGRRYPTRYSTRQQPASESSRRYR